jgi:hypothetical protein
MLFIPGIEIERAVDLQGAVYLENSSRLALPSVLFTGSGHSCGLMIICARSVPLCSGRQEKWVHFFLGCSSASGLHSRS